MMANTILDQAGLPVKRGPVDGSPAAKYGVGMEQDDKIHFHDLSEAERKTLLADLSRELSGAAGIRLAYAFGSFVRGEPFRDLDVAVVLEDAGDWRRPGRLAARLQECLTSFPASIEVVPLNDAPPVFRKQVADEGTLLYEAVPGESAEVWVRATSECMDLNAWLESHGMVA